MVKRKKRPGCFWSAARAFCSYAVLAKENTPITVKVGYGGIDPLGLFCYPPFYTAAAHRKSSCPRLSGAQKLGKISETPVFSRLSDFVPNNNIIVNPTHNTSCFHIQNSFSLLVAMSVWQKIVYAIFPLQYCRQSWGCLEITDIHCAKYAPYFFTKFTNQGTSSSENTSTSVSEQPFSHYNSKGVIQHEEKIGNP